MKFKKGGLKQKKLVTGKFGSNDSGSQNRKTIQRVITRNNKIYIEYTKFRKKLFAELAPKDSEVILYMLPWLFSINRPECPGYVKGLKGSIKVYNVDKDKDVRARESGFKRKFGIRESGVLMKHSAKSYLVQGLYTIGSIGSISQTSASDCDIWVCIDKREFDKTAWIQLNEKVNLIKDWLDTNIKIPVYFFISDLTAIRECHFGSVDSESSGSTQQNVLKEEFYRTCMVICGKIPLWWLCYDKSFHINYKDALAAIAGDDYWEYDLIDFGDVEQIEKKEYFGAALWQFHKSLSRPLKSIIKMSLLQMLLDAPEDMLMCHKFRERVLFSKNIDLFPDSSVFTMSAIVNNFENTKKEMLGFFVECLYIRCGYNPYNRKQKLKNQIAGDFFKPFSIAKERQSSLRKPDSWTFKAQLELGDRLLMLMLQIYKEISETHTGVISRSGKNDLTVLGRKISAFYMKKKFKIRVMQKPTGTLNISNLNLILFEGVWFFYSGTDRRSPVISNKDLIFNIAYIVWNNLFIANMIQMKPNSSSVTHQEIINIGTKIRNFFGTYETFDVNYAHYLKEEFITKMLIIIGLEKSPWYEETMDFRVVYTNCWGELFSRPFGTTRDFELFILKARKNSKQVETGYYIRRNATSYEKIIDRTKQILTPSIVEEF